MKYAIIVGSHREGSQSAKVGKFMEHAIKEADPRAHVYTLDLANNPIPFWTEDMWEDPMTTDIQKKWAPFDKELHSSDAFVIIAPEWGGMVPAGLKNLFLMANGDNYCFAYKPALIVTVSAARGGAYPVAELRMSGYKNTFIQYLPEHIIVRDVKEVMNDFAINEENKADAYIKKRSLQGARLLHAYAEALKPVRQKGLHDFKTYPNGM